MAHLIVRARYDFKGQDETELAFVVGDVIEIIEITDVNSDAWWEGRVVASGRTGTFPVVFTAGWEAVAAATSPASLKREGATRANSETVTSIQLLSDNNNNNNNNNNGDGACTRELIANAPVQKAKALFSYEATCVGELCMEVGDVVTILCKNTGSEAWWEGEGPHGRGQFPVNYVELVDEDGLAMHQISSSVSRPDEWHDSDELVSAECVKHDLVVSSTRKARALYRFEGNAGELTFQVGDLVSVIDSSNTDWWEGFRESDGPSGKGAFPAAYVEMLPLD
ncbi:hypothetical protein SeLEV6574_g07189 [Synchytrium endobioticum]|uniref:SH3 domain-containing protein n=1 Tax=Synchytrium endobioticum TaxID=286115 RepID=A0A507CIH3_9FUNG|nr:hypothetical protein SeLEV6574_g07189 [Synchytrium endobioticum]